MIWRRRRALADLDEDIRDHLARVTLILPSSAGPLSVEFIVDTGFEGDLALPSSILR